MYSLTNGMYSWHYMYSLSNGMYSWHYMYSLSNGMYSWPLHVQPEQRYTASC